MSDLELCQRQIRIEGFVSKSDKGTPVVNPLKALIQMNAATILSYRRSLQLHARAQGGESRDVAKRRAVLKEYDDQGEDDGLLASRH